ncbi:MAG: hypothetical protein LBT74_05860 [Acidobacteriota bacterium]|jgi:ubiquitin-protein ligase|nr:hypothetical protein [Acidobacteriota bacterium]
MKIPIAADLRVRHRLAAEHVKMMSLNRPGRVEVALSSADLRAYTVAVSTPTFVKSADGGAPEYAQGPHVFTIRLPIGWPYRKSPPVVAFSTRPVAHVNVFAGGNVCIGDWNPAEDLRSLTCRVIRLILLDGGTFNFKSPADRDVAGFCSRCAKERPHGVASIGELLGDGRGEAAGEGA